MVNVQRRRQPSRPSGGLALMRPNLPQGGAPQPFPQRPVIPAQTPGGPVGIGAFSQVPGTTPPPVRPTIPGQTPGAPVGIGAFGQAAGGLAPPRTPNVITGDPADLRYEMGGGAGDYGSPPAQDITSYKDPGFQALLDEYGLDPQSMPELISAYIDFHRGKWKAGSDMGTMLLQMREDDPIQQMLRQIIGIGGEGAAGFAGGVPEGMNWLQNILMQGAQPGGAGGWSPPSMGEGGVFNTMMRNMGYSAGGAQNPLELLMRQLAGGAIEEGQPVADASIQQMLNLLANPESLGQDVQTQIMNAARDVAAREGSASERRLAEAMNVRGQADSGLQASLQRSGELQTGTDLGTLEANLMREGAIRRPEDIARAIGLAENLVGGRRGYGMDWAQMGQGERGMWHQTGLGTDELGLRERMGGQNYQMGMANLLQNLFGQQAGLGQQNLQNMFGLMQQQYSDPFQMIMQMIAEQSANRRASEADGGGGGLMSGLGDLGGGLGQLLGGLSLFGDKKKKNGAGGGGGMGTDQLMTMLMLMG